MSEQESKLEEVDEEEGFLDLDADLGRAGSRAEIPEYGMDGFGPVDGFSNNTPPHGGSNVSGGLRLPLGESEPLNQPSGNITRIQNSDRYLT